MPPDICVWLFFEPFYRLMRLQLLAQEMESGEFGLEMDAEVVSVDSGDSSYQNSQTINIG